MVEYEFISKYDSSTNKYYLSYISILGISLYTENYVYNADKIIQYLHDIDKDYGEVSKNDIKIKEYDRDTNLTTINIYSSEKCKGTEIFDYDLYISHKILASDIAKLRVNRYDEEKNKYFHYQEKFNYYYSIDGEIYTELIKWYYDKMNWSYEEMSPEDFVILRIDRTNNGNIIIYDTKNDRYVRFKIYRITEESLNKDIPKINIKRLFLKNHLSRTNYFIDVEKTKKYARFDKEDGVVSSIVEVKLYDSGRYCVFSIKK